VLAVGAWLTGGICAPGPGPLVPPPDTRCDSDGATPPTGAAIIPGAVMGDDFRRLMNGVEREYEYGPQGGQHIYVDVRAYLPEISSSDRIFSVRMELTDEARDERIGERDLPVNTACAPGWVSLERAIVFVYEIPRGPAARALTLSLNEVDRGEGRILETIATSSVTVTITEPR